MKSRAARMLARSWAIRTMSSASRRVSSPSNGPGLARIRGEIRSSWITDPADGRIPWTKAARAQRDANEAKALSIDNVESRDTGERCLTASGVGAPLINSHDTNLMTFVLTRDHLLIVTEKNHDARVVRLGVARDPLETPSWWGSSVGRWVDTTLVVETDNFRPGLTAIGDDFTLSHHARVVERFTRTGPKQILYLFEVNDPTLFSQTWKGEMIFRLAEGQMYEFACHEGNYSMLGILGPPVR